MTRYGSLRQAAKASNLTQHQVQKHAVIGSIRTLVLPGQPIKFHLDDAAALSSRERPEAKGAAK